jgi:hypothetical protein
MTVNVARRATLAIGVFLAYVVVFVGLTVILIRRRDVP